MLVSVLIPIFNEEKFIENCLLSVQRQILKDNIQLEIFVIDGGSEDKTLNIIENILPRINKNIKLLYNINKYQSYALNLGIQSSKGEFIIRLDAHSIYPDNYIQSLIDARDKLNADNIGGVFTSRPYNDSYSASLVQALTTHWFGVGNSSYRLNTGPSFVDTVPYGCFKRELFEKIGYFDQRLRRCQDYEINQRIRQAGGKIWLDPTIEVFYYNQPNVKKFLSKQFFVEAPYNAYMWFLAPYTFAYRHAITGVFSLCLIIGSMLSITLPAVRILFLSVSGLYLLLSLIASFQQAVRYNNKKHLLFLPGSFFLFHFIHGLGILKGIIKLLLKNAPVQKIREPWNNYGQYRIKVQKNLIVLQNMLDGE